MKKTILMILFLLIPVGIGAAYNCGVKKSTESISVPIKEPLDSDGLPGKPDTIHIYTYADNGTEAAFAARSVIYPFDDISVDTLKRNGDTTYWLVDDIADIDGAGGNFVLGIDIVAWTGGIPTHTHASVQIITDSLAKSIDLDNFASTATIAKAAGDSVFGKAIADTVQGKAMSRVLEGAITSINHALFAGFVSGAKTIPSYNADVDTLFLYDDDGTTLINQWLFFHIGGVAGQRGDSIKMIGP